MIFIKSDGSPLVKLVNLIAVTLSIWMIWHMRNNIRFKQKINLHWAIKSIKDLISLAGKTFTKSMKNDILDFSMLKF